MQLENDKCKGCGQIKLIVNKKYCLCNDCNRTRLHPNEEVKVYQLKRTPLKPSTSPLKRNSKPIAQRSKKSGIKLKLDEETYEQVYNNATKYGICECENCGLELDSRFRDEEGHIVQRFRYSHILSKGAFPEHRHNVDNFNFLCFNCHQKWEFGGEDGRSQMKIYVKNEEIADKLFQITHSKRDS